MATVQIRTKTIQNGTSSKVRLDFPTERQLGLLVPAWTDGKNHQICFVDEKSLARAARAGEYASMIVSADLVLPKTPSVAKKATEMGSRDAFELREVSIPSTQEAYLSLFLEDEEESPADSEIVCYNPLHMLNILMSILEQRNGSVFLLGGAVATLQKTELNLRSTFPRLRLVGRSIGNYLQQQEAPLMTALQKTAPDLIIVGSLVEGGELWIPRHMNFTRSGIFVFDDSILEVLAGSN
ncbi:MAG TPA: WecB/TagA/CpsF family glycosyltransferase [Spirochaetales bacterium]|nr:WecB/TagA/CpsF family glycosyltransferase [Spirochaetales bacterium]